MNIERAVPLGRLTTVGIGGPARHFARPGTVAELEEGLRWAASEGLDVFTIGLGSNVLVADDGVDALVLRLEGELAAAETHDSLLVAGGGAANAVCLPSALRFNQEAVPDAIARFGTALGSGDPAGRCADLALLGGFARLRDLGVPQDDLEGLASATATRAGAKANPRPASTGQLTELFAAIW